MYIEIIAQQFYDYSLIIKGYSKETIRRYRVVINAYRKFAGIEKIEEMTEDNVRFLFYYGRIERKWSPNTFIIFHKSLLVFFRWCVEQKYLQKNLAEDIEVPKLEKKLPPKLTKQEAMRLLEVIYNYPYTYHFLRHRNYALFATFLFAGLRRSELLKLKYADVDIENFSIFVRQGKGGKDRVIPMSTSLAHSLQRYVDERKRLKRTCPEFFTSLNRNMGLTNNGLKHLERLVVKASGIKFTPHKLRHTFATLMIEGGCDIYSLSKMLGHSDIKTTTIYLAASIEHLRSQIGKHPMNSIV